MFYYLFGWEMRHLHTGGSCPVVSGQEGVCDYDRLGPTLGGLAQCCRSFAQFFILLYSFEQNPALLCAYIIYRYKIIN